MDNTDRIEKLFQLTLATLTLVTAGCELINSIPDRRESSINGDLISGYREEPLRNSKKAGNLIDEILNDSDDDLHMLSDEKVKGTAISKKPFDKYNSFRGKMTFSFEFEI